MMENLSKTFKNTSNLTFKDRFQRTSVVPKSPVVMSSKNVIRLYHLENPSFNS